MSEHDDNYTRRRLLQATAGVGIAGGSTGAVTGAYLSEWRRFPGNDVGTGSFELELATKAADDADAIGGFPESGADFENTTAVDVDLPTFEPGDGGIVRISYRLCENPGWIWLRASVSESDLAGHLDVRLIERPNCGGEAEERFDGTLAELVDRGLDGGVRLGDACIGCDPACLDFEWNFDSDPPADLSGSSLSLSLEFAAMQCRHNESSENPWN
jgi:hypothetical protein